MRHIDATTSREATDRPHRIGARTSGPQSTDLRSGDRRNARSRPTRGRTLADQRSALRGSTPLREIDFFEISGYDVVVDCFHLVCSCASEQTPPSGTVQELEPNTCLEHSNEKIVKRLASKRGRCICPSEDFVGN